MLAVSCSTGDSVYKAYFGAPQSDLQIATIEGMSFYREDLINRYWDAVRFLQVDDVVIENSEEHDAIQVEAGFHEMKVYFHWDLGSQRGLAPALVNYAKTRDTMTRDLRFNARAGETYVVRAQPYFNDRRQDVTTISHVDFWVEDGNGNEVVSRDQGRYIPSPD